MPLRTCTGHTYLGALSMSMLLLHPAVVGPMMPSRTSIVISTAWLFTTKKRNVVAITTTDSENNVYLIVTNQDSTVSYKIDANLSSLISNGTGTMWQFDAGHKDTVVGSPLLKNGHETFTIPTDGAIL